jgi:hypothetical protein
MAQLNKRTPGAHRLLKPSTAACALVMLVVFANWKYGGLASSPAAEQPHTEAVGEHVWVTGAAVTSAAKYRTSHPSVKLSASARAAETATDLSLAHSRAPQRSSTSVEDEPTYDIDVGQYRYVYSPLFMPLDAVQHEFRALAQGVPACRIGKHRQVLYKLLDPRVTDEGEASDVEPPLTSTIAALKMRGNKLGGFEKKWPSRSIKRDTRTDRSVAVDEFPRDEDAQRLSRAPGMTCLRQNALIALAAGFDDNRLVTLVGSFQRYASPCDILVLMRDSCSNWPLESYPAARVECVGVSGVSVNQAERERVHKIEGWLRSNWRRFDYVIHADSRDTQFFADPFLPLYSMNFTGLFGVGEAFRYSDFNTGQSRMWVGSYSSGGGTQDGAIIDWIAGLRLGGRAFPVICSGLYGGSSVAMLDFVTAYAEAIATASPHAQHLHGVDQGILIHLFLVGLPTRKFPHPLYLFDEGLGPYTHFLAREQPLVFTPDGRLINCHLQPYAIAHQLDRHDDIDWRQRARYRPRKSSNPDRSQCRQAGSTTALSCAQVPLFSAVASFVAALPARVTAPRGPTHTTAGQLVDDPRSKCETRDVVVALVPTINMEAIHQFVASWSRHMRPCCSLHLILLLRRHHEPDGATETPAYRELLTNTLGGGAVQVHEVVFPSDKLVSPLQRVQVVNEFLATRNFDPHSRVAVFLSVGGAKADVSVENADATEAELLEESSVLFSANIFQHIKADTVHVAVEPRPAAGAPDTHMPRRSVVKHHLLEQGQLRRCSKRFMRGGSVSQSDILDLERALRNDGGWCDSKPVGLEVGEIVVNPVFVVGPAAAVSRYLHITQSMVVDAVPEGCSVVAVLSYVLPVSLARLGEGAALRVQLWEPDAVGPVRFSRTGLPRLHQNEHGQFVDSCVAEANGKTDRVALVLGLETEAARKEARHSYTLNAPPNRVGDEDAVAMQAALMAILSTDKRLTALAKNMPPPSLLPFAATRGLHDRDEFPFTALFSNGSDFFRPSRAHKRE